jgi:hypothetical protein
MAEVDNGTIANWELNQIVFKQVKVISATFREM